MSVEDTDYYLIEVVSEDYQSVDQFDSYSAAGTFIFGLFIGWLIGFLIRFF